MEDPTKNERLIDKLQKILALTKSPQEGEAAAAAAMLQKFLTQHNLSIADLESKGQAAPGIREERYDLGKAAFQWKLNLAEVIADHYFCVPMVSSVSKRVSFIGRPENVEALQMLYGWLMEQIKRFSREAWRKDGQHIDKLRWHVNYCLGSVDRIGERLEELRDAAHADADAMALVVHHSTEISDWMEETMGRRADGKMTKADLARQEAYAERRKEQEALLAIDPEAAYQKWPHLRPITDEQRAKWAREDEVRRQKSERMRRRHEERRQRQGASWSEAETWRKEGEGYVAQAQGRREADKINLQPFIERKGTDDLPDLLGSSK